MMVVPRPAPGVELTTMQGDGTSLVRRRRRGHRGAPFWVLALGMTAGLLRAVLPGGGAETRPTTATAPTTRPAGTPPDARITADGWFARLPAAPKPQLPEKIPQDAAFVIPIHDGITMTTHEAVLRKAQRCKRKGAKLVVFDMNTPGGLGRAMTAIARVITGELKDIYTVAYVHPEAISAGAVISLACDEIVMVADGLIGDAMPIFISPQGGIVPIPKEERGKIESYSLAQVRSFATRNGYNQDLCESMITLSIEIWLIRNRQTRELQYLNLEKHPKYAKPHKGDEKARSKPPLDEPWDYVRRIVGPLKILTMTTKEAGDLGFVRHVLPTTEALFEHYGGAGEPKVLEDTWSETLVEFLTSPAVTGLLVFVGILGIYVELNTPGVGLPGAVAVIAFVILFGSRYLTGLAHWWEIALFLVGLALVAIEVFVTPGFGVLGISGVFCCLVGLLAMIVPNAPDKLPLPQTDLDWGLFKTGLTAVALAFLGALVAAILLARYLPKMPLASKLILVPATPPTGPASESAPIRSIQVGQTGTVHSICRPVGQVRFGDKLVDAVADGAFIAAGTPVTVIRNEGNRVVVTPKES